MRTIKPITAAELAALRAEPQKNVSSFTLSIFDMASRIPGIRCAFDPQLPARIIARMRLDGSCWRVSGWNSNNGFAKMGVGGRHRQVHRVVYKLLEESLSLPPLGDTDILDHVKARGCRFRDCSNPFHLEPVTVKINTERGLAKLFQKKGVSL
jgi:hypothetical protein